MIKRTILVFLLSLPGALADAQERTMESNTCPKTTHIFRPDSVPAAGPQWQLVLEDEFDGPAPDTSKWLTHAPWGSVLFFGNKDRFDSAQNGAAECAYAGNLQYQDGHLQLMVKKEDVNELSSYYRSDTFVEADGLPSRRTFHYSAGVLFSKKMYGPGKFEIRCKLPLIDGVWPAFWLYGSCGQEFDVFEFLNERYRESTADCNRRLHMTYHRESTCADPSTWFSHGTTAFDTVDYSAGFHVYSVEWDEYQVTWRVDGQVRKVVYGVRHRLRNKPVKETRMKRGHVYRLYDFMPKRETGMNIIVSCAVTNYGNARRPVTRGKFPAVFEVDYVRAWTRK